MPDKQSVSKKAFCLHIFSQIMALVLNGSCKLCSSENETKLRKLRIK